MTASRQAAREERTPLERAAEEIEREASAAYPCHKDAYYALKALALLARALDETLARKA